MIKKIELNNLIDSGDFGPGLGLGFTKREVEKILGSACTFLVIGEGSSLLRLLSLFELPVDEIISPLNDKCYKKTFCQ